VSDIENAILEVLNGDTAVRALVGARIFENQIAQNAQKPALTYQLVSDPSEDSHSGPAGLAYARMQFDGWGLTKEDARAVTRAERRRSEALRRIQAQRARGLRSRRSAATSNDGYGLLAFRGNPMTGGGATARIAS
jgi:hypothetical protein